MAKAKPKELTPEDPEFLPVQYDLTQERLNQLAVDYDPKTIPNAEQKGDDGYVQVHNKVMAITKVRTNIEKVRKGLKADALEWGRKVDGEAKRLTAEVEALEEPWRKLKTDLDEKEAREAEEARKLEEARLAAIESRIAGIKNLAEGLIGADADEIQHRINVLQKISVTEEEFGDYVEAAKLTGDITLKALQSALEERQKFESEQAELQRQQAELAESKAEMEKAQKELDKQKAAQEAAEAAERARKEREEAEAREAKEREEREAAEAKAEKKRKAELKKRLPQDTKAREYVLGVVGQLQSAEDIGVSNPDLLWLVAQFNMTVDNAGADALVKTQEKK